MKTWEETALRIALEIAPKYSNQSGSVVLISQFSAELRADAAETKRIADLRKCWKYAKSYGDGTIAGEAIAYEMIAAFPEISEDSTNES